jgi:phage terminase large subunit
MSSTSYASHSYAPYGAARDVFHARDPEVLLSGPAGTGKSRACLEKLLILGMLNPGVRMLAVRKTQRSLAATGLVTWREHVAVEALASRAIWFYGGSAQEPACYLFANGSRLVVGGMDVSDKIMSSEYDLIYVQEATELTLTDWEKLTTRLRNGRLSFQQLLGDCNPGPPKHWLKQRCDGGPTRIIYCHHSDNPVLIDQDTGEPTDRGASYLSKLDALTGVRRLRLRDGVWAAAEGIVYDEFDPFTHLIDHSAIPSTWERYWTVDFGYVHPFVLQCWAVDPDGRLVLYREIFHTGRTPDQHAKTILDIVRRPDGTWIEPRPVAIITDHASGDRALLSRGLGMPTVPAKKNVDQGLKRVKMRLRPDGRTVPRLRIMRDALVERDPSLYAAGKPTSTEEEFGSYVWPSSQTPGVRAEAPVKEFDDGMDAMRYMVMHLDTKSTLRVS